MSENCSGVDECGSDGVSAVSMNEKGKNKRKFLSDFPLDIPVKVSSLSLTEFPRNEIMEENFQNSLSESEDTVEEQDMEEFQPSDWDDPVACQLEKLLANTLFSTLCTAVNKIVERGYTEEVAEWAVLQSSLFHGSADALSNVMDSALALLKWENGFSRPKHPIFESLQSLVDYTLLEMIHVLREVRPSITVSEAMWRLLICDLNLATACVTEEGTVVGSSSQEAPRESNTFAESKSEISGTSQLKDSDNSGSTEQIMSNDEGSQPKSAAAACNQSTNIQCPCESGKRNSLFCQEAKGKFAAMVRDHIQSSSQAIGMDEKSRGRGKFSSSNSKKDLLRQTAFQFEKSGKGRMSKGGLKAKVAAWGSMVVDKSLRSQSGSSSVAMKGAPTKLATSAGGNSSSVEGSSNMSSNSSSIDSPSSVKDPVFAAPAINSKTHASSITDAKCSSDSEAKVSDTPKAIDYYASIPFDKTIQKHVPLDDKDEAILMLVPHKQDIEKEIQGWMEWANKKVMQAARRLGKDKAELKMLMQEKEEMEKFKKEKQTLEESTMKRLSEMESALTNATSQIEVSNSNIRRLEEENNILNSDLEAARLYSNRAATNLETSLEREQETLKKLRSWETEKSLVQKQLTDLKRDVATLNNRLEKAKERLNQFKALLKQEEKEKLKVQKQIDSLRREVEEETALMQVETGKIKEAAKKEMQKCEVDIKNLENLIAELGLESYKSKIAALNMGYVSYLPGSQLPKVSERLAAFENKFSDEAGVKRERECVMCMTEEISVVFIPCAHQVLCIQCNGHHEKQGMNDCPSCRTPIQRRLSVSYRTD